MLHELIGDKPVLFQVIATLIILTYDDQVLSLRVDGIV